MLYWIAAGMILCGVGFLLLSLTPIKRIVHQLPDGRLKKLWKLLGLLVLLFIVGYILYGFEEWSPSDGHLVPFIFFSGGLFVFLVVNLSEKTAKDIQKIATLKYENITDPLMKIHNRRYFEERMQDETHLCLHSPERPLSLLLIDVDHFKTFNDTYGHQKGDEVLITLAERIQSVARKTDVVARYGGEEVCVIAPLVKKEEAMILAERLRQKVAAKPIGLCRATQEELMMTVSVGVATWQKGESPCMLVSRADQALYHAKESGRNRVIHADSLSS